jgi:hypothetical protein
VAFGRALAVSLAIAVPAGAAAIASPFRAPDHVAALSLPAIVFSQPAEGSSLQEGETVQIRWSGVPANAEEIELLLSVDGGQHFSLRLTDELDSSSGSFLWRVPSLLTDAASLAIRMGARGDEILSAPGPLFRLSHSPSTPAVLLRWEAGEIWVGSRGPDEAKLRRTRSLAGLSTHPGSITSAPGGSDAVSLRRSSPRPASVARVGPGLAFRDAVEPAAVGSLPRLPLTVPQRI